MRKTLGSYLIELLEAQGVQHVFGIPGVHNLELYRGLASSRIRHVTGRHGSHASRSTRWSTSRRRWAKLTGTRFRCS